MGIRWGLCCQFADGGVRFRQATHRYVATLEPPARLSYLRDIARSNAIALAHAVARCAELEIGAFRINSQILPLITHPVSGYTLQSLDDDGTISRSFVAAGALARALGIRLSFHPDQFVVLNSTRDEVVIVDPRAQRTGNGGEHCRRRYDHAPRRRHDGRKNRCARAAGAEYGAALLRRAVPTRARER